jgi:hypothetical protein
MARSLKADVLGVALGTAAALDAGIAPGNLVQVQAGGKLPALDGSLLTGVSGAGGAAAPYRGFRGGPTSDVALASNAVTSFSLGRVDRNIGGFVVDGSRAYVPAGVSKISVVAAMATDNLNYQQLIVRKNSIDLPGQHRSYQVYAATAATGVIDVVAGDYIELVVYSNQAITAYGSSVYMDISVVESTHDIGTPTDGSVSVASLTPDLQGRVARARATVDMRSLSVLSSYGFSAFAHPVTGSIDFTFSTPAAAAGAYTVVASTSYVTDPDAQAVVFHAPFLRAATGFRLIVAQVIGSDRDSRFLDVVVF